MPIRGMKRREFIAVLGGAAGVAAGGAGAAGGETADHRVPGRGHAFGRRANGSPLLCSDCANSAGSRGAPSRSSIAGRRAAASARRDRGRVRPSQGRCHCHVGNPAGPRGKAGDIGHPDRLRGGRRPGRHRPGRESGATGWQRHRPVTPGDRIAGKRLELLREVVPGLRRLAIVVNVGNPVGVLEMGEVQAVARTLGLEVVTSEIRRAEDIAPAFEALKGRAEALYVVTDPLLTPTGLASTP